jgi:hypothetical protein
LLFLLDDGFDLLDCLLVLLLMRYSEAIVLMFLTKSLAMFLVKGAFLLTHLQPL